MILSYHVRAGVLRLSLVALVLSAGFFSWNCKSSTEPTVVPSATDVTLAAPAAGEGLQVKVGPFTVPAGTEVQKNYYLKLPNTTDIWVNKVVFRFNAGSHHLNIFKSDTANVADTVIDTFDAIPFAQWDLVGSSQVDSLVWEMPNGCAFHLNAHQQMIFQTHYVNASTQATATGRGLCLVNFYTLPAGTTPANPVGAVFSQDKAIDLPPHTAATYLKVVKAFPNDANIVLMTGHFHSRGKSFIVTKWKNGATGDTIYKNNTWDEPPVDIFSTPLHIAKGDSLAYITSYENTTDKEIKFGGHVEIEEHSNLFTYYYPAPMNGKAIYDFDFGANGGKPIETHPIP